MISKEEIIREYEATSILLDRLRADGWVDDQTILVCCSPTHSAIISSIISSAFPSIELLFFEYPEKDATYVFNRAALLYEPYERYAVDWVRHLETDRKYLFATSKRARNDKAHFLLWNLVRKKYRCEFVTV